MSEGYQSYKKESKRLRFTSDDDLALLREFIYQKPLEEPGNWGIIQDNVFLISGKKFSIRTLKDHLFLLLETWLQKDSDAHKNRSGFVEIYSERDQLLQEVSEICNSSNINSRKRKKSESKEKQIAGLGRKAREQCDLQLRDEISTSTSNSQSNYLDHDNNFGDNLNKIEFVVETGIRPDISSDIPELETTQINNDSESKSRQFGAIKARNNQSSGLRISALGYLQSKHEKARLHKEKELEFEEKRLQLEERKLTLQEKQFEMELLERKEKLVMEKEKYKAELFERNRSAKLIESQQQLIQSLMTRLRKYEDC